jgi:ferric-dicitrate binding protein FerR (iron transport regulator)
METDSNVSRGTQAAPDPMNADPNRRRVAEALGTAILLAAVVGSGIMADRLSGGKQAIRTRL